jgi:hypothetical protein
VKAVPQSRRSRKPIARSGALTLGLPKTSAAAADGSGWCSGCSSRKLSSGGASGHTYIFTRRPDGLTDIDVVVVRDGKNLIGWVLGFVLGTIGKGVLRKAFENSVKAIEARTGAARGARASQAG